LEEDQEATIEALVEKVDTTHELRENFSREMGVM
jgi:hypothetical protein